MCVFLFVWSCIFILLNVVWRKFHVYFHVKLLVFEKLLFVWSVNFSIQKNILDLLSVLSVKLLEQVCLCFCLLI